MIEFENWQLTPPDKDTGNTLWKVELNGQRVGFAIKYRLLARHFTMTMTPSHFSEHKRAAIVALFDATFGAQGAYFKQKEQSCPH